MECTRFRRMISRELDGVVESAERDEIERHLASCEGCRAFRQTSLEGFSIHRSFSEVSPPPSLLASILAAGEARPKMPSMHGWLRFAMTGAAAAAGVIGIWIGALMHESYAPKSVENHTDVLELKYLDEYPPGSFGDILTASYQGGGDEQR